MNISNLSIINLSELNPRWCWLKDEFPQDSLNWHHYTNATLKIPKILPQSASLTRAISAWKAVNQAIKSPSLLVSHGPRPALYAGSISNLVDSNLPHLVYSFNFTTLPTGLQHKAMAKAYKQPQRFVCFSSIERELYAKYFDISIEFIDMLHWAVHKPKLDLNSQSIEKGEYICALGSQARDYKTLFAAMKQLPHVKLVVVASEDSVKGITVPSNVKIHTNIPLSEAQNILMHSQFTVLPLNNSSVPCGHVTIVSAMFHQKAIIATNSVGIHDYIQDGETGKFVNPQDENDLAKKIIELWEDSEQKNLLSLNALNFADTHCTEKTPVDYFQKLLNKLNTNHSL